MSHGTTALSINHEAKNPPSELRVSRCRHGPRGSQNVAGPLWRRRVCFCTHCQAHVVNALDGGGRMHVATVSTAMTRQLPNGQPMVSHLPHTAASRLHTAQHQGVLPICHLHFAPPHERQQRPSAGSLRKLARTLAYTARRHTATAAGLFGRDAPTNAMCSSHRRLCARARSTRGRTRDKAEARVTHYAARLIPAAGCPLWSAGSVARTSRPPHR